jgi:hypothetical protein
VVEGAGEGYDLWVFLLGGHVSVLFSRIPAERVVE